jgi:hypothetical protein
MSILIQGASSPIVREDVLPGSQPSWNPHVSIPATLTNIEAINGPAVIPDPTGAPTGGDLSTGWQYPTNYNTIQSYPTNYPEMGYYEKRMLAPPDIMNGKATFVEIDNVAVADQVNEDFTTCYANVNFPGTSCIQIDPNPYGESDPDPSGRAFPTNPNAAVEAAPSPNAFGDMTLTISNPAYWANGNQPTPGIHRMHVEIDRGWQAYAVDTQDPSWDAVNGHVTLRNLAYGTLIDLQGFVYWDPAHLTEAFHNYSGFELHPVTAWRLH